MALFMVAACHQVQGSRWPEGVSGDMVKAQINQLLQPAGWSNVSVTNVELVDKVGDNNRDELAAAVVDHAAALRGDPGTVPMVQGPEAIASKRAEITASFKQSGLIASGDFVVRLSWHAGSTSFETFGVLDGSGKMKFEPILYFQQRSVSEAR